MVRPKVVAKRAGGPPQPSLPLDVRGHPGRAARQLQGLLPEAEFRRLLVETTRELGLAVRYQESAVAALRGASEELLRRVLRRAGDCAAHAGRRHLRREDVRLATVAFTSRASQRLGPPPSLGRPPRPPRLGRPPGPKATPTAPLPPPQPADSPVMSTVAQLLRDIMNQAPLPAQAPSCAAVSSSEAHRGGGERTDDRGGVEPARRPALSSAASPGEAVGRGREGGEAQRRRLGPWPKGLEAGVTRALRHPLRPLTSNNLAALSAALPPAPRPVHAHTTNENDGFVVHLEPPEHSQCSLSQESQVVVYDHTDRLLEVRSLRNLR
eukprot:EG_transcript_13579